MRAAVAMLLVVVLAPVPVRGSATVVVRVGDPSPLGLPFSHLSDAALDDAGRIAFVGGSTVLFRRTPAGIVHIAGAGDVVQGRRIVGVSAAALGTGCLAFRALLVGDDVGIVRECGTTASVLAALGSSAPNGGRLVGFADDLAVGADGRVAFIALLDDGTSVIVLIDADGTQHEVTRTRAASPSGGTFTSLRLAGIAAGGHVGFHAATSGGPDGLFYWHGTDVRKLTVVGDGSPAGGAFTSLGLASMNDAETWTFRAGFASGGQSGVFRVSTADAFPSPITAVVVTGGATPVGGTFKDIPNSLVPAINGGGLVAFRATVEDAPSGITSGIFVGLPDGSIEKAVAVGESTAVGDLVRLRTVALADDDGVVLRASLVGGAAGLFRARGGQVERLALLGDPTDLGSAFRFSDAHTADSSEAPIFLGTREGLFVADGSAPPRSVAVLGDPTPLRGRWAGFDSPASGGRSTVFGASIEGGRSGEALFAVGRHRPVRVAASGEPIGSSLRLLDFFSSPLDNLARPGVAAGAVAFQAGLGGGTTSGIVLAAGGTLRAVARQGQRAPGGGRYRAFGTPALAPGARVAFVALGDEGMALYGSRSGSRSGGAVTLVAAAGGETGTRLKGIFRGFDTPAAGSVGIAFRATLEQSREGVFLARGRCTMAIAGTGESDPGGAKFRTFDAPAVAGRTVVFRAVLAGAAAPSALYRAHPARGCTQEPPSLDLMATTGVRSPAGPPLLALGAPGGNRHGAVAIAADLTGAGPSDAIIYYGD